MLSSSICNWISQIVEVLKNISKWASELLKQYDKKKSTDKKNGRGGGGGDSFV